jgi:hypothetical protein
MPANKHRKSLPVFFFLIIIIIIIIIYAGIIGRSNMLEYIWITMKLGI